MTLINSNILNTAAQEFILKKWDADIVSLLLKKPIFGGISNKELAQQLEARKKCKRKLPLWFGTSQIYYPHKLHIEQTSSEITARYKSEIISTMIPGKSLVDATGGFGVDSYFFGRAIAQVYHCEIDKRLSAIAAHNFKVLGVENIMTVPSDGIEFLKSSPSTFDWIYLDPSRRNDDKGKVFRLSDCLPDVTQHLELLFKKAANILLKTSPLLDLSIGIEELSAVKEIHVIAVNNEVKELLWVLKKGYSEEITVKTINTSKRENMSFDFPLSSEKNTFSPYSQPLSYLYEPNAAIMKSGAFKTVTKRFQLKKLHEHTHLYTSDTLIDFPGRRFRIMGIFPYAKRVIKSLKLKNANVSTRNFPESVAEIRKKFGIGDGGDSYLFFVTVGRDIRMLIISKKLK